MAIVFARALWLVRHVCYVSVSHRINDASSSQANELHRRVSQCPTKSSHEATGVHSTHLRATFHVLHSPSCCPGLSVSLSISHDCLQLLLFHMSRSTPASCSCTVSYADSLCCVQNITYLLHICYCLYYYLSHYMTDI